MEPAIGNRDNNAAVVPLAGGEPQLLRAFRLRHGLSKKLYRVAGGTAATAVAGLAMALKAADSLAVVLLLLVILLGALGTGYLGFLLEVEPEHAPSPRLREAGVAAFLVCLLMLVVAVTLVGSVDYYELAVRFMED